MSYPFGKVVPAPLGLGLPILAAGGLGGADYYGGALGNYGAQAMFTLGRGRAEL